MEVRIICFQLILILNIPLSENAKILATILYPSHSHFYPLSIYYKELARNGHNITLLTTKLIQDAPENIEQIELTGSESYWKQFDLSGSTYFKSLTYLYIMNKYVDYQLGLDNFQNFLRRNDSYDLLIMENIWMYAYAALSYKFGSPPIIGITTLIASTREYRQIGNPIQISTDTYIHGDFEFPLNLFERLQNAFYLIYEEFLTECRFIINDRLVKKYIGIGYPPVKSMYNNVSLLFHYGHDAIELIRPQVPTIINIGGLHIGHNQDYLNPEVKQFLDSSKSGFIYISLGSTFQWSMYDKNLKETFIEALLNTNLSVLWKDDNKSREMTSEKFYFASWLPQEKILDHPNIRLFITQGGLQSIQEAVHFGVPLLGLPLHFDQFKNLKILKQKGVALTLDKQSLKADDIVNKIQILLCDKSFQIRMKQLSLIFRDRPMGPLQTAVWWTEFTLRHDVKHLRPLTFDFHWLVAYNIDVIIIYLFIFLIIILGSLLIIRNFLIRKIIKKYFKIKRS